MLLLLLLHHRRRRRSGPLCHSVTPADLRSPQRGQRYSVGILLDIVEPDVARGGAAVYSSWPSGFCLRRYPSSDAEHHVLVVQGPGVHSRDIKLLFHFRSATAMWQPLYYTGFAVASLTCSSHRVVFGSKSTGEAYSKLQHRYIWLHALTCSL